MRLISHVDMNSYFASVEQQANPFLRGRAVGVCAYLHKKGCVIAASVEAKQRGMKVGMTMEEAQRAVPSAVFVQNDPPKYRACTSKIFAILHELSDRVEHYSIDEAFLDLTGWYRDAAEAAFALSRVKRRIRDEVGEWLRCSIGLAPTRFLSKFASERKKPDGLTVITPENLEETLAAADLEDACGIGPRIRRRLERIGILSLLELKRAPVGNLMRAFGKNGFFLWAKVNGIECEPSGSWRSEATPKSIGHSYCVPNRVNREKKVEAVLLKLTERAGRRLRAKGLLAGTVSVAVGFRSPSPIRNPESRGDFIRLLEPADDSFTLTRAAQRLLQRMWNGESVDFLAVTLSELAIPTNQMRLPVEATHELPLQTWERIGSVSQSLDRIRDRYGETAIILGRMFPLLHGDEHAPDRIGYRKTGALELERPPEYTLALE